MPKNIMSEIKAWSADSASIAANVSQGLPPGEDLVSFLNQNSEGWTRTARVISRLNRDVRLESQRVAMLEEECAAMRKQLAAQEQRALFQEN